MRWSPRSGRRASSSDKKAKPTTTTGSSTLTIAGAVMGTPAYMAPEQARGEPLDERADVFALGAMLYHLLAGVPPYNARTATDVIAAAALGRVVPLVEREKHAPLDLVAIVNRAMAQEPSDRYPHAGELAEELRRFLTGQLVDAHRYTALQKATRFVKKHRAAVTISALSLVAFGVLGTLAIQRIVEERDAARSAREIAVTRRQAAEKLIDRMLSDVKERLQQIGRLDILSNLGGEIRDYYGTLGKMPGGMPPEDGDRMALAVDLVGLAERESGRIDSALKTWTEARAKLAASVGDSTDPTTLLRRRMIARFDFEIGTVHQQRGKVPLAIKAFTLAKNEFDALRVEAPKDRQVLLQAADTHDKLGDLLRNEGKIDAAFEEYSEAKAERELAGSQASSRPSEEVLALSTSHMKLGSVYQARGESATALAEYKSTLRLRETLLEGQPDNVEVIEKVLDVRDTLAELQNQVGDEKSAIETYKDAIPVMEMLARRDPMNTTWKRQRGNLLANLGFSMLDTGDFKGGLDQLQVALDMQKELVAKEPKAQLWQGDVARTLTRAGDGQMYLGETKEAIDRYGAALDIRKRLVKSDPKSTPYRRSVAWSYSKLANAFTFKNDLAGAFAAHEEALVLREQLVAEAPSHSGFKNELASTEIAFGRALATKDPRRSKELIAAGMTRARAMVSGDAINGEWKETLTQGLLAQAELARVVGDKAARLAALTEARTLAHASAERAPQNAHWPGYVAEVHVGLAELATDARSRAAEWKATRDALEPLAKAARLSATRKNLLDRALAGR
ncbi:MAG: tetratricopeptide repeat protein [Myxococcales bacterium]|nr:tetratricopeptide repeat protein [Myxococcales bacterium]